MREFPQTLYREIDHIIVDTEDAIIESGDVVVPLENNWISKDRVHTMSSYLVRNNNLPSHRKTSILFKTTGMVLFDAMVAQLIYEKATEKQVGAKLVL